MIAGMHNRFTTGTPPSPADPLLVRLRLIGQMEAWTLRSESILPTGRKTRALLAILALSAPRPVLRGKLAETLWSRRPEEQARASLRQEIHRLLEAMEPDGAQILVVHRDHLMLRPGTVWVDVEELLRATPGHPAALALLDGDLLEDLNDVDPAFDIWLAGERERLRDRARQLAEHMLREQADPEAVVAAAQQLLAIDREHEGAWRALMRGYAESGERGMAIQAYERCRAVLAEHMAAQPSKETEALVAKIRADSMGAPPASGFAAPAAPPPLPPAPAPPPAARVPVRLGVLPPALAGTSASEATLPAGLADQITVDLARFRWIALASSAALARFAHGGRDGAALRQAFGLDYVLDGTIQRSGERLRITLLLLDLRASEEVVWSRRLDREAGDALATQDEIATHVVAQLEADLLQLEGRRAAALPPDSLGPDDLVHHAVSLLARMDQKLFMQAGEKLRRATEAAPEHASAHVWLALWYTLLVAHGWAPDRDVACSRSLSHAERGVRLDPMDARALAVAAHAHAFLYRRLHQARALHQRALAANPNLAMVWALAAFTSLCLGEMDAAAEQVRRYKALAPQDPLAIFRDGIPTLVALLRRDHAAAAALGLLVDAINPGPSGASKPLLAALGHLGRHPEAARTLQLVLAAEPDFTVTRFLETSELLRPADRAHFAEGLRLAGVPA
jgi:DNA-binding SARP family transcriptional activator/TolB-like protein